MIGIILLLAAGSIIYYLLAKYFVKRIERSDRKLYDKLGKIESILPLLSELLNKGLSLDEEDETINHPVESSSSEDKLADASKRKAITFREDTPDVVDIEGNQLYVPISKKF